MSSKRHEGDSRAPVPASYAVAAAILLLCGALYWISLGFDEVPPALSQGFPPERFPQMVLGALAFLALALALRARRKPTRHPPSPVPGTVYATGVLILVFMLAQQWLGTLPALVLFLIALPLFWGERCRASLLLYAVGLPVGIYFLFGRILQVRFFWGVLEPLFH